MPTSLPRMGPAALLQSPEWQRFQDRLGRTTHLFHGSGWYGLVVEETHRLGTIWYLPYGPVVDTPEHLSTALRELQDTARAHGVAWLRVEPQSPSLGGADFATAVQRQVHAQRSIKEHLETSGGRRAPRDIQPALTRWVDLSASPENILAAMTGTNRNLWRRHRDKGIEISSSTDPDDVDAVITLLHNAADAKGFTPHDAEYLRAAAHALAPAGAATIYTSTVNGVVVSAVLVYDTPTTRIFAHSGMDASYRKLRPNQPLIAQALLDAAERGQTVGDLFGVAPPDMPEHPWTGFSKFKRSFGGADVPLGGTWDIPVSRARYGAYRGLRAARTAARGGMRRARTQGCATRGLVMGALARTRATPQPH